MIGTTKPLSKISEQDSDRIRDGIKYILNRRKGAWYDLHANYPISQISQVIESIPGVKFKTFGNDSQFAWWVEFEYENRRYRLSGDAWSGGHSFMPSDNQVN